MIIIMKPQASKEAVEKVTSLIESKGLQAHLSEGSQVTIVGVVGDKSRLAGSNIEMSEGVDKVVAVTESYKLVNKKFHPDDSIIPVGNTHIGPGTMTVMAGPCAIESKEQLLSTAFAVKKAGATFLRGGAYKPRTSPYSFQGLEEEGLKYTAMSLQAIGAMWVQVLRTIIKQIWIFLIKRSETFLLLRNHILILSQRTSRP